MTRQEELLAALRDRRLTPEQVLATLASEAAQRPAPARRSAVLGPHWRPWQRDAHAAASGWPTFVVDCGTGRAAPAWSVAERTQRLTTRATTRERRFTDLAGQFLVWLQRAVAMHPNTALRVVALTDSADVGLAGGLAGLFRSVALERPRLLMQAVQVARDDTVDFGLIEHCDQPGLLRLDADGLYVQDWRTVAVSAATAPAWRDDATYLITGGSGGLGLLFAGEIARAARRAHLVLVGRRAATPAVERELARLVAAGATADYRALDVAQPDDVRRLVREINHSRRPLSGILHCAGVVQDRHLVNKSTAEFEAVLRPKVDGIVALDEASASVPLDFFVAFSSLASVYGNAGQCDYAAANGFMDGYAAFRHGLVTRGERHGRSLSINWPLWRDGGMRTDPSIIALTAQSVGLEPIATQAGLAAFGTALAADVPQAMVLYGDLARLTTGAAAAEPAPVRTSEPVAAATAGDDRLLAARTVGKLKTLFSQLTLVPVDRIDKDAPIEQYGVESVAVTALNAEFAQVFGVLSPTLIYEHQTLASLADYFCREHGATCRVWCGLADLAPPTAAAPGAAPEAALESFRERYASATRAAAGQDAVVVDAPARPGAPVPIAIIGIAGRYPGARNLDEFWANLEQGRDAITEIPASRWPVDLFFHPDKGGRASVGKYYCRWGGFVDDFAQFDPQFFGISPREAHDMDPQERLFLECCWATVEDAGYTVERLRQRHASSVGVFVGVTKTGYERYAPQLWAQGDQTKPTTSFGSIANRVSYLLDLRGPSLPIDTMCSASLTALHEACEHLARGECELALAGGVNLYLHPSNFIELCAQGMLSPDGRCRSFGAGANGFVPGEGVGAVLLKPLARAVADGDHIHAVIASTSINHGGKTNGYTVPNPKAQAALIRRALDRAGISARSISYIEAHGTGTELGDPIEVSGLTQAFAHDTDERGFCALGSLKSNIGHLEAAAGIAGLTKIVLQLRHRRLVPTLHSEPENAKLVLDATPFVLQRTAAPWRAAPDTPLRAGLSSFGAGGANAHLVVEQYRAPEAAATYVPGPLIFVLSARNKDRLRAYAQALLAALPGIAAERIADVAYTLQIGRDAMAERLAIVAAGRDELIRKLGAWIADGNSNEDVVAGRVAAGNDPISELSGEQELLPLVARWLAQQRYAKVLGLWVRGMNLDWPALTNAGPRRIVPLPTYPFEPRDYWFELAPPAVTTEPVRVTGEPAPAAAEETAQGIAVAGALSGNLTLVPLWNVLSADEHAALRMPGADAAAGRTLVVNAGDAALAALRQRWPDSEAVALGRDDSAQDIARRLAGGGVPARVVWIVADRAIDTLFDDTLLDAQADGVRLGFRLLKALLALGAGSCALDLRAVTYRTQRVLANQRVAPAHAAVHGLVASAAKEFPHWSVSLADLDDEADWSDPATVRLPPDPRGRPWARRGGRWYRPVLVPQQGVPPATAPVYRDRGVYVVIGGAGHVGERWSEHLAQRHDAQVVWIGRRPLDDAIGARIARIARRGRAPVYLSADATDAASLTRAAQEIRARFGAIHGVVHAALVLEPRGIADLGEAEFLDVMGVKFTTGVRAAQVFGEDALDFLLFFSSLVAVIKNPGQSHYAAGCCAADAYALALADHWRDAGPRVRVLNWGYWDKAENTDSAGFQRLAAMGIGLIGIDDGLPAVEALLAGTAGQVGFMKTTKPLLIEGMSLDESLLHLAGATPVDVAAIAATATSRLPDHLSRGNTGELSRTAALEASLSRLLAAELGAMAQSRGLDSIAALAGHIQPTYARWLAASVASLADHGDDPFALAAQRAALWDAWQRDTERPDADAGLRARARLAESGLRALADILTGATLATEVLFKQSSMVNVSEVYRGHTVADFFNTAVADAVAAYGRQIVAAAGDTARIRILEVGAGTGGTSRTVIERIASERLPVAEYCYTDISRAFLMHAEDVFKPLAPYLTTRLFDAEKSPTEQGMEAGAFDIVIATNVLHATRDIRRTVRNVKATLRRGGLLALNEMNSPSNLVTHLTFGLTKGWWLFEDASVRVPGSPGLTPASWKDVLESEGYADVAWPAAGAHALGQQIVLARSDGVVRVARGRKVKAEAARVSSSRVAEPAAAPVPTPAPTAVPDAAAIEARVHDAIVDTLARSLRMDRDDIAGDEPFADFGLDSIIGIGFVRELNETLGITLETTVIFDYSTAARLTGHVVASFGAVVAAQMPQASRGTPRGELKGHPSLPDPRVDEQRVGLRGHPSPPDPSGPSGVQDRQNLRFSATALHPLEGEGGTRFVATATLPRNEAIAVIGLAGRFAGSPDVDALWAHLAAGDDLVGPVRRWDLSHLNTGGDGGCRHGSFIDHIDRFDPMFFSISGLEATYMDPKQRLFLEECWKALETAGYAGEAVQGLRCGVYVGNEPGDYNHLFRGPVPGQAMWGVAGSVLPARIAYFLDLQGPAISVDTACSSSLVAMHLACQALWGGEIEMALAGGASVESTPGAYVGPGNAGMLSRRGRCYTFDARADGFVPGEGVGVVVLKRLSDALAAGDHVHGVIRGSGLNQDGTTNGITAPSARSQERLECDVYERFGIDPGHIGLVEAHGTGTELGDPIEFNALVRSFRRYTDRVGYCAIGSIKTNIGHAKAAAGIAGLLKILLAFRHRRIPASLHFENVNPNIDFAGSPFRVATASSDWPPPLADDGTVLPRCAAISAFGMSGTNAHLVLEEAPASPRAGAARDVASLIVLSAMSAEQLRTVAADLAAALAAGAYAVADVSLTLLLGRRHTEHRIATVVNDAGELAGRLRAWLEQGRHARVHAGYVGGKRAKEQPGLKRYGDQCLRECAADDLADAARAERLDAVADLYVQGYRLDYAVLFRDSTARRVPLPVYPFAAERYWVPDSAETPPPAVAAPAAMTAAAAPLHPLLHAAVGGAQQPRYRSEFDGSEFFFADHVVNGRRLLPGVAHLEMARAAWQHACAEDGSIAMRLRNVIWARPLVATDGGAAAEVRLARDEATGEIAFEIAAPPGTGDALVYSQGRALPIAPAARPRVDLAALRAACSDRPLDRDGYYAMYAALGVDYGPGHRGIATVQVGDGQVLAQLRVPAGRASADRYGLHPSLLDSAFQATAALWLRAGGGQSQPSVPFALDSLDYYAPCPASVWACIRDSATPAASAALRKLDIDICDDDGNVCVRLLGFTTRVLAPAPRGDDVRLFVPQRRPVEVATDAAWPAGSERLVVVCGLAPLPVERLRAGLPGVRVETLPSEAAGSAERYRDYAAGLLLRLARFIGSRPEAPLLLQLIVADDDACAAGLNAMLRTARLEQPRLATQMLVAAAGDRTDALLRHLGAPSAARHDAIWLAREATALQWQPLAAVEASHVPWRSGGVYLITGGLGALGLVFAREIAARTDSATVVLAGRSVDTPRSAAAVASLSALGIRAVARAVDIADRDATAQLVASIHDEFGRLDGVIHSAGVAVDRLILAKTVDELDTVFAAKVGGIAAIDAATAGLDLDFLVTFSSMSGVMGSVGQADYAAANGYLDAFAVQRNASTAAGLRRGRCVSIAWPYWTDGGMRTDPGVQEAIYRAHGLGGLSSADGVDAFYAALASTADQVLVLAGDVARLPALAAHIGVLAPFAPVPAASPAAVTAAARPTTAGAARFVRRIVASVLKLPEARIDIDAAMEKYGIDSIMVMNLTNALEQHFGSLSKTLFYEYQTIAELAGYFERQHADRLSELLNQEEPIVSVKTPDDASPAPPSAQRPAEVSTAAGPSRTPQPGGGAGDHDVAIVGMAGRFPQADTLDEFWDNLSRGRDSVTEVPRWRWQGVAGEDAAAKRWGGFIDGAADFDPLFFGISPREALVLDPQERLFLQCAYTTLEHAGYTRQSLADACPGGVGVYVGVMYTEYPYFAVQAQLAGQEVAVTGSPASVANRVSYYCGFDGPSLAIDSMCSSSLATVHLACQALALGECDAAIAGGVNVSLHPNKFVLLEQGNFASGRGRCESFGAGGEGYVPSEGVGAVLLKPLARAIADGDRIHGVIKATGINHGGKTNGYTVPNPNAQARLIRRVLDRAGIAADAVSYIEAHGTGTSLGDPIEITGLVKAFGDEARDSHCLIGSVKSNIGHCESAAGVAALCKVLLQFAHGAIAPSLHSARLNPNIDFASTPFEVVQQLTPWTRPTVRRAGHEVEMPRIAGISSFGAGGANAHLVVAEHRAAPRPAAARATHAFVLSARTEDQLRARARQLVEAVQRGRYGESDLASIAWTLMVGREPMNWRFACTADSLASLAAALSAFVDGGEAVCTLEREDALDAFHADAAAQTALDTALAGGDLAALIGYWINGVAVAWARLYDGATPLRIGLPGYPFASRRFWYAPPRVTAATAPAPAARPEPATPPAAVAPIRHAPASAPGVPVVAAPAPARSVTPVAVAAPARAAAPVAAVPSRPVAPATPAAAATAARAKPSGIVLGAAAAPAAVAAPAPVAAAAPAARTVLATPTPAASVAIAGPSAPARTASVSPPPAPVAAADDESATRPLAQLRRELAESFASVLFMELADVDERRSFGEMGMDSVLAVEWIRDINQRYGIAIEATDIYDHSDIRAMARLVRERRGAAAPAPAPVVAAPAPAAVAAAPAAPPAPRTDTGRSLDALRKELTQSFAGVLFMEVAEVDERRSFGEMGMDSVLAVEWIRDINVHYGIGIEATDIYDYPDIRAMARLIKERLDRPVAPDAAASTATPAPAPARPAEAAPSAAADAGRSLEALRKALAQSFASVLFMDVAEVDERRSFGEMGMDSVLAVEWIRDINTQYGVAVEATDIYDYPDIRAMARLVKERLDGRSTPVAAAPAAAVPLPPSAASPAATTPATAPAPGRSLDQLRKELKQSFANVLFMDIADVDERRSFGEMGMDSVLAVEWIRDINAQYGIAIEATDIYDHADIRAMAVLIGERLAAKSSGSVATTPAAVPAPAMSPTAPPVAPSAVAAAAAPVAAPVASRAAVPAVPSAAAALSVDDILKLVQNGTMTVDEAERLLAGGTL